MTHPVRYLLLAPALAAALLTGRAEPREAGPVAWPGAVQLNPLFVGMGDSIGEGVQSADANEYTQPANYLSLVAARMGAAFPLPLIRTSLTGVVGSTVGRARIDPAVEGLDLAVSGADVSSILNDRANAADASQIDNETDLVLFPRQASQIEIAEALQPQRVACWIGNNDVLSAVTSFDQLDASQLTPIADFTADFTQLAARLSALGSQIVLANVPDVTDIAFLADGQDLVRFLGSDFGLPADSRTTVPAFLLVKLGLLDPSIFADPNYVLDAVELDTIQQHVGAINDVIESVGAGLGIPVADVNAVFHAIGVNPPVVAGVPLTLRFLGGLFSLDGVHPSNVAHAIVANLFIQTFNGRYGTGIAPIDVPTLGAIFLTDPFIDKDGDGRVRGRFGRGLLETLGPLLGISGDLDDRLPGPTAAADEQFFAEYRRLTGVDLRTATRQVRIDAFRRIFGLQAFSGTAR